jgi:hypothetical protein
MSVKLLCTMCLFFLLAFPTSPQINDPIENYLSSAEEKADNVVYNAGAQGRGIAMEAGQAVLNGISAFRALYKDALQQAESSLTKKQYEFFKNIKQSTELLDETLQSSSDNFQQITNTMALTLRDLPFTKDVPRVIRFSPLYSVDGLSQELVVQGIGLSNGNPVLELQGRSPIKPNTTSDVEIRFPLPSHEAVAADKPLLFPATLKLYQRVEHTFSNDELVPKIYPVRLAIYSREIGQISITPRRKVPSQERQSKATPMYRCESPHGDGSSTTPVQIVPDSGYQIDISTIKYNRAYENHGSFTMNSSSPAGFTATLSCYGWDKSMFNAGQQGVESGSFTFDEFRDGTALQNGEAQTMRLKWGDSLTLSTLPADTDTILFEIKPFTGQTLAMDGSGTNRFVRVDYNPSSKVVTVSAQGIEQAMRQ